ncbi:MAG: HEAT repeat domain-containing protein [Methylococcales bacterium]
MEEELSHLKLLEEGYSLIYKIKGTCKPGKRGLNASNLQKDALLLSESNFFTFARNADKIIPGYLIKHFQDRSFMFLGFSPKSWEDRLLVNILLEKRRYISTPCYTASTTDDPLEAAYWNSQKFCNMTSTQALGQLKAIETIQPLIEALADESRNVQGYAAYALGELKAGEAIQPLIKILENEPESVRTPAAGALGKLAYTKAIEFLLPSIYDSELGFSFGTEENIYEVMEHQYFGIREITLSALTDLAEQNNLLLLKNWLEIIKRRRQDEQKASGDEKTVTFTPEQLTKQIDNVQIVRVDRIQAPDNLVQSGNLVLAKQTLLELLANNEKETLFRVRIYQYLADLRATEALDTIQGKLSLLDQQ